MQKQIIEIWKKIKRYEHIYSASSFGRIRNDRTGRILKPGISKGYLKLVLCDNTNRKSYYLHIIIATTFMGECPEGKEVNHKDFNKLNCNVLNLEYLTHKENCHHSINHNRFIPLRGNRNGNSKLTEIDVLRIRSLYNNKLGNNYSLAKKFNVDKTTISNIVTRKQWVHI